MKISPLLLNCGLLLFLFGCEPAPEFEPTVPEVCYEHAELNWSVNGVRQYENSELQAIDVEQWSDFFQWNLDGSWYVKMQADQYDLHLETKSLFEEEAMNELGEEEWKDLMESRGSYKFSDDLFVVRKLTVKSENVLLGPQADQIIGGQVHISFEKGEYGTCQFVALTVSALLQNPETKKDYQLEFNLKTPYVFK